MTIQPVIEVAKQVPWDKVGKCALKGVKLTASAALTAGLKAAFSDEIEGLVKKVGKPAKLLLKN